jgi:hypothetical protein
VSKLFEKYNMCVALMQFFAGGESFVLAEDGLIFQRSSVCIDALSSIRSRYSEHFEIFFTTREYILECASTLSLSFAPALHRFSSLEKGTQLLARCFNDSCGGRMFCVRLKLRVAVDDGIFSEAPLSSIYMCHYLPRNSSLGSGWFLSDNIFKNVQGFKTNI